MKLAFLIIIVLSSLVTFPIFAGQSAAAADSNVPAAEPNNASEKDFFPRKIITGPKAWAVACCALLVEYNNGWHDTLATELPTPSSVQSHKDSLKEWWGIESKADLLESLNWLESGGHRELFERLGWQIHNRSFLSFFLTYLTTTNKETRNKLRMAYQYYDVVGKKSLIGWDLERAIYLCRVGYECGYISEDEAWEHIMNYARYLQQTFDSWEDLGRNYIIGRNFWSYEETLKSGEGIDDAFMVLIEMPSSPWNTLPWNMNLEQNNENHENFLPKPLTSNAILVK
jgi:hypothetical protein